MVKRSTYLRQHILPPQPPPVLRHGIGNRLHRNLFASPMDCAVTLVLTALAIYIGISLAGWLFFDAVWNGQNRAVCTTTIQGGIQPQGWSGACWAFVKANFSQILYGFYPQGERWRVNLTAALAIAINIPLLVPSVRYKFLNMQVSLLAVPLVGWLLLYGGYFDLAIVDTQLWGGLMVTLIIAYTSIAISLPLGTLLALGRRSRVPVLRLICIVFIEILRGIPLVAILFIASVMFPLFLPQGMTFDKLLRALIGIALFTSVYIAEVVRGGLQAVPASQYEAAASLGLRYTITMCLIILPQAYRLVIPGIINTLIGMFKETSLIYIISMFDLLGIVRVASMQANWVTPQTPATAFVFAGFIFWIFCFAMSRYANFIEKRMNIPQRRQIIGQSKP